MDWLLPALKQVLSATLSAVYPFLKVAHLVGVGLLFMSIGGLCINAFLDGTRETLQGRGWALVMTSMILGFLITISTAFAMLSMLGGNVFASGWVHAKLGLWFVLGVASMLVVRVPQIARGLWCSLPLLLAAAAWLASTKPF